MSFVEEYATFAPVIAVLVALSTFALNFSRDIFDAEEKSTVPLGGGERIVSFKFTSAEAQALRDLVSTFSGVVFGTIKLLIILIAASGLAGVVREGLPLESWWGRGASAMLGWLIFSKHVLYGWLMAITPAPQRSSASIELGSLGNRRCNTRLTIVKLPVTSASRLLSATASSAESNEDADGKSR